VQNPIGRAGKPAIFALKCPKPPLGSFTISRRSSLQEKPSARFNRSGGLAPTASGANSVASALGSPTRRDPGEAVRTYHQGRESTLKTGTFYLAESRNFLFGSNIARSTPIDLHHASRAGSPRLESRDLRRMSRSRRKKPAAPPIRRTAPRQPVLVTASWHDPLDRLLLSLTSQQLQILTFVLGCAAVISRRRTQS
jgi:hypothetical protein